MNQLIQLLVTCQNNIYTGKDSTIHKPTRSQYNLQETVILNQKKLVVFTNLNWSY